jgi:hypothetical protein
MKIWLSLPPELSGTYYARLLVGFTETVFDAHIEHNLERKHADGIWNGADLYLFDVLYDCDAIVFMPEHTGLSSVQKWEARVFATLKRPIYIFTYENQSIGIREIKPDEIPGKVYKLQKA